LRLSDLLRSEVVDTNGRRYGTVEDVLIVQDGPLLLPFGAAFRVDRLIVGTRQVGTRLGYNREGVRGPWVLRALFGAIERSLGASAKDLPFTLIYLVDGADARLRRVASTGFAATDAAAPDLVELDQPWPLDRWPDVPTRVLSGRDDRMFPAAFQRRVAKERLGLDADEIPGGHMVALANPAGLADQLDRYAGELRPG